MKRYFMEYESDKMVCNSNHHIWGSSSSLKTAKGYIRKCRQVNAEYNPRNFRIYDTQAECDPDKHVPCVYQED